ncbi:MAG: TIGR04013 family B12-binding domain/radical SAM domain-containing protein [Syntrophaceae bacterium]|nr:TIGR04013 family B12-binding domain/radical SAM domain-containing protein [Syntrophaceae bacterium]
MESKKALVFYYTRENRYSYNALAGALETDEFFNDLPVYFLSQEKNFTEELHGIIKKNEITIVAFSFATPQLWQISSVVKNLRKKYKKQLTLIAGGPHPSGDIRGTLQMGFDIVAKGEGEELIIELLKRLHTGQGIEDVVGIACLKNNGDILNTGKRSLVNIDKYPPFSVKYGKLGPIEITRGCPYACHYCQTSHLLGTVPRHRSIESICQYVETMKSKNIKDIRVITPNALSYGSADGKTLNLKSLEELLKSIREIISPDGKLFWGSFPSEVRPEHVTPETIELIVRYANSDNLIIGAQSGSQHMLEHCNRSHSITDIYESVELTIKAGLQANVDFIFGLPGETKKDTELTIMVIRDLARKGARIHAHTFMPLPQTSFSAAPAGKVAPNLKKVINELNKKGLSYGDWIKQEKIAKHIEVYRK